MTEAEWLACDQPHEMLVQVREMLPRGVLNRKLRLYICRCCRLAWDAIAEPAQRSLVETAERFADGEAHLLTFNAARAETFAGRPRGYPRPVESPAYWAGCENGLLRDYALKATKFAVERRQREALGPEPHLRPGSEWRRCRDVERGLLARTLADIFGNPFRPAYFDAAWRTPATVSLALAAHAERALPGGELDDARLAILSDALEEAGCDAAGLLSHLRSPGPHVRGCWALDLVLGRGDRQPVTSAP